MHTTVLIIDDDKSVATSVRELLVQHGYAVTIADHPKSGIELLNKTHFDLVILDEYFGDSLGSDHLACIKHIDPDGCVLMLSCHHECQERIRVLRQGADDFLSKPYHPDELLLKASKLIERTYATHSSQLTSTFFTLNLHTGEVIAPDWNAQLRKKELQILRVLMSQKNKVISKSVLIEHIWGIDETPLYSTVDVHIRRLRQQLHDRSKTIIRTVYRMGYMFYDK